MTSPATGCETAPPALSAPVVSPRTLVRYRRYDAAETLQALRYGAIQPTGTVGRETAAGDGTHVCDVIGFATLPRYQSIGRFECFEPFKRQVTETATYCHWRAPETDCSGDSDAWAQAHERLRETIGAVDVEGGDTA